MAKVYVVGIGPGSIEHMTAKAVKAFEDSDFIIGYSTYIDLIKESIENLYGKNKVVISSSMKKEKERCIEALKKASQGYNVCLVSSGDSGIYGMAGIMLEVASKSKFEADIEVVPGITAASAASAILGAPLNHDFCVISLSDLLTPWDKIELRLEFAAKGDFIICLYNPKSIKRVKHIKVAREIIMKYRNEKTPVGIVRNAYRKDQKVSITNLENMLDFEIDMFSIVIVGNSQTYVQDGKIITPRGYELGDDDI